MVRGLPLETNVLEAVFANEAQAYARDVVVWPPREQWPSEVHMQQITLNGVTDPVRAQQYVQMLLTLLRRGDV